MTSKKPLRELGRHQFSARLRSLREELNQVDNANNVPERDLLLWYVQKVISLYIFFF